MKKILPIVFFLILTSAAWAQVPQLPEFLQEKFDQEQLDLTMTYDETENINSEEDYYYYINRDLGVDTLLGYRWSIDLDDWVLHARIIETYGNGELLTEKLFQLYTPDGNWENGLYFQYSYNDLGNLTEMVIQHWAPDMADWVNHFKKTQTYDDSGLLTDINTYWWRLDSESWIDHQHKVFTYDNGFLVADTVHVFHLMMDDWQDFLYNEFDYNGVGMKVLKTNFRKWMPFDDWQPNFRWQYAYDDAGENVIMITGQDWHQPDQSWVDFNRFNYTYNDAGDVSYYLFERWNLVESDWSGVVQIDYFYNDAGLMSQFVMQHKPMCLDEWTNKKQAFFSYDDEGNMTERILQFWAPDAGDWVNFCKWSMVLDYKGGITGISDPLLQGNIKAIYRNPYQPGDKITFSGLNSATYTVSVLDMSGRLIYSQKYLAGEQLTLPASCTSGTHILTLSNDGSILLKEKIILIK